MKKRVILLLVSSVFFGIWACEDKLESNNEPNGQMSQKEFVVENVQTVQVNSKVTVITKNDGSYQNKVILQAPSDIIDFIDIHQNGKTLLISTSDSIQQDINLNDSVKVLVGSASLESVVLDANQEAVLLGPEEVLESISIETKGSSQLLIMDLKAAHLDLVMKGNSEVTIENQSAVMELDSTVITDTLAQLVGMNSLMLSDSSVITGDSINTIENVNGEIEGYVVYTSMNSESFMTENAIVNTVGDVLFNAGNFPVGDLEIHLIGNSEAIVNVQDHLSGSGTGNSKLSYYGNPTVNFMIQGNAEIVPLVDDTLN